MDLEKLKRVNPIISERPQPFPVAAMGSQWVHSTMRSSKWGYSMEEILTVTDTEIFLITWLTAKCPSCSGVLSLYHDNCLVSFSKITGFKMQVVHTNYDWLVFIAC